MTPVRHTVVTGNRQLTFKGYSDVAVMDTVHDTLSVSQFRALLHAVDLSGLMSSRNYNSPNCEDVTDAPTARTEVRYDGQTHFASHYFGCLSAPETLRPLEDAIDSIVDTERWVVSDSLRRNRAAP